MRVLFLNPPSYGGFDGGAGARYQARREIRSFWYPIWLAYPAALVSSSLLVDAPPEEMDLETVLEKGAGFEMLVMHTSTPTFQNDCRTAESFKARYPGMLIGLVGPHVMVLPEETLSASQAIDFVCTGEFDYTIKEIAEGAPLHSVAGIAFRKDGKIVRTPERPLITDLDSLPFPTRVYARDLKIEKYFDGYLRHPYMVIHGGRGCRARCTFCLWPQTISGRAYRTRSPENVFEEVLEATRLFPQVKEFMFDDATFTGDLDRALKIADKIGKLGITWSANARANVPARAIRKMKDNGLRLLVVGFESGDQGVLDNMKKGITLEQARQFARDAREAGVLIHAAFIVGLPGETRETIAGTMKYARELDPYSIQVSLAAPYPGTELYAQARREGWLKEERSGLVAGGIQRAALSYDWLSSGEIFESVEKFYRDFYLRPRPILRIMKEMLSDFYVFRRRAREGFEFFSFLARRDREA